MQFQVLRKLKYRKNAIEPAANDDPNPEPYLVRTCILVYGVEQKIETIICLDIPEYKYLGVKKGCINRSIVSFPSILLQPFTHGRRPGHE